MAIDAARMHDLACRYAQFPSEEHLNQALEACLPLCALIARRFLNRGAEYDDLYQVACLSCVNALKSFDPNRGLKFSTFVTPTVTGAVRNCLRDQTPMIRAPRIRRQQGMEIEKVREAFLNSHHAEPTVRQLAEALGWEMEKVLAVWTALSATRVSSLEEADENGLTLGERLPFLEPGFNRAEQREDLSRALSLLTEEENLLLSLRYTHRLSQRDAANRLNKTQMQISRMERRILAALRKELSETP
ncbi:MAG: sigma-70 family RNA polymerase sigma factor [Clostridia bacterium]|nr:sigma-70 family RNA polymerase sigma factor [Clostridia bacterium]